MDPITSALNELVACVTAELRDPAVRVVLLHATLEDSPMVARALRAAEWDEDNRSPFLIFDAACADPAEAFPMLSAGVLQHYELLRQGVAAEGTVLPPLSPPAAPPARAPAPPPELGLKAALEAFTAGAAPALAPPVFCWLPANVAADDVWSAAAIGLLRALWGTPIRLILLAPPGGALLEHLDRSAAAVRVVPFAVDAAATQEHFAQLLGPPSPGRGPGTLPGAAAPDVVPPARLRPGPSPEATRAELERAGITGVLAVDQGERLRTLVVEAAMAAGKGDGALALERQAEACALCEGAGARVELVLMSMLAASYQLQFGRVDEAVVSYQKADRVAGELGAYPQLAQARIGLGYLWFSRGQLPEAVAAYEQAALAALLAGVNLLTFEALRLLGTCHQQLSQPGETALCWEAAVHHARRFSPDELRMTAFPDVAAAVIDLYRQSGQEARAARISAIVEEIGARAAEVRA